MMISKNTFVLGLIYTVTSLNSNLEAKNYKEIASISEYNNIVRSDKPAIIMFSTPSCGPCKTMEPNFDAMARENKDITFAKVNADKLHNIAEKKDVKGVPTCIFTKDGKEYIKLRTRGSRSKEQLKDSIKELKTKSQKQLVQPLAAPAA